MSRTRLQVYCGKLSKCGRGKHATRCFNTLLPSILVILRVGKIVPPGAKFFNHETYLHLEHIATDNPNCLAKCVKSLDKDSFWKGVDLFLHGQDRHRYMPCCGTAELHT